MLLFLVSSILPWFFDILIPNENTDQFYQL